MALPHPADSLAVLKRSTIWLFILAAVLLLIFPGSRELWTQEHRWADTVSIMFYRHDFLHPWLGAQDYYDKPLLSYWLIAGFAALAGKLSAAVLRLPSALAGLLAIGSIVSIGTRLKNRELGLLAGWMLATTFYFVFWARTSSADMLNMAGTLFAVAFYFARKASCQFLDYLGFFLILAITALCKGLVGPAVAALAVLTDMLLNHTLKQHLRLTVLYALLPALVVYFLPFQASAWFNQVAGYHENGLSLVWRENVVRYFHPFDHKGPIYTYLIFLPVYLLPWTLFFIPALAGTVRRWRQLPVNTRWMALTTLVLFVFFTLSGSRRNYYILPVVPFALLMTADWILSTGRQFLRPAKWLGAISALLLLLQVAVFQPLYYATGGAENFARVLKQTAETLHPWQAWKVVLLDPESKVSFYLGLPPDTPGHNLGSHERQQLDRALALKKWPFLAEAAQQKNTIYVTRRAYSGALREIMAGYRTVGPDPGLAARLHLKEPQQPIAFISRA